MNTTRLATLVASLVCALLIGSVGTASAQAATTPMAKTIPVTAAAKNGKKLRNGTLKIDHFAKKNGKLYAVGTLRGTFKGQKIKRAVSVPAAFTSGAQGAQAGTCSILDLTLGPIHLNLLGLVVDTNRIHLTITGQTGPGNLLGNLLCGIANLLNPGALANTPLGQLVNILNALLALSPSTA